MTDALLLPVSLGEAIDKLSILEIKLEEIKDNRRIDVENEFNALYYLLKEHIIKYEELYNSMKKVNKHIWVLMDQLRDGSLSEQEYFKLCKECIELNDVRFRIKNKINCVSNSIMKEQKGYKTNRLLINIISMNESQNDLDRTRSDSVEKEYFCGVQRSNLLKYIKNYSFYYDEIIIITDSDFLKNELFYDTTIIFTKEIDETIEYKKRILINDQTENIFDFNFLIIE